MLFLLKNKKKLQLISYFYYQAVPFRIVLDVILLFLDGLLYMLGQNIQLK